MSYATHVVLDSVCEWNPPTSGSSNIPSIDIAMREWDLSILQWARPWSCWDETDGDQCGCRVGEWKEYAAGSSMECDGLASDVQRDCGLHSHVLDKYAPGSARRIE